MSLILRLPCMFPKAEAAPPRTNHGMTIAQPFIVRSDLSLFLGRRDVMEFVGILISSLCFFDAIGRLLNSQFDSNLHC